MSLKLSLALVLVITYLANGNLLASKQQLLAPKPKTPLAQPSIVPQAAVVSAPQTPAEPVVAVQPLPVPEPEMHTMDIMAPQPAPVPVVEPVMHIMPIRYDPSSIVPAPAPAPAVMPYDGSMIVTNNGPMPAAPVPVPVDNHGAPVPIATNTGVVGPRTYETFLLPGVAPVPAPVHNIVPFDEEPIVRPAVMPINYIPMPIHHIIVPAKPVLTPDNYDNSAEVEKHYNPTVLALEHGEHKLTYKNDAGLDACLVCQPHQGCGCTDVAALRCELNRMRQKLLHLKAITSPQQPAPAQSHVPLPSAPISHVLPVAPVAPISHVIAPIAPASKMAAGVNCNQICPMNYDPICGVDGQTYSNMCTLQSTNCMKGTYVIAAYSGACSKAPSAPMVAVSPSEAEPVCSQICTAMWDPICGTDGVTYGNDCEMKAKACRTKMNIQLSHAGQC